MKQTGFQTALYGLRPSEQFVRQQEGFPHRNDAVCLNVADDAGQFAHNKYSGPIAGCLSGKENRLDNAAVKPNYVPLLMVLLVLGAPVGAVCAVLMLAAFGWVPLGTWRGWLDFPYSLYFLATGWFIGLIPALSTWIAAYALMLRHGIKGTLWMSLAGGVVSLVFGWFFYGMRMSVVFGMAGLLSAAVFSIFLPKNTYAVPAGVPDNESTH